MNCAKVYLQLLRLLTLKTPFLWLLEYQTFAVSLLSLSNRTNLTLLTRTSLPQIFKSLTKETGTVN